MKKKNQEEGFYRAFVKNKKLLAAIALDITKDSQKVDDVLQDVYLSVAANWQRISHLGPERQRAYLCTATRNRSISLCRSTEAEAEKARAYSEVCPGETLETPENLTITRESLAEVKRLIAHLDEDLRIVLELSVFYQLGDEEISGELGISTNLVRVRRHRARQKLKAGLKEVRELD